MPNAASGAGKAPAHRRAGKALVQTALLAAAVALPLTAHPVSLTYLLSLPLERLLELQICDPSPPRAPGQGCTP